MNKSVKIGIVVLIFLFLFGCSSTPQLSPLLSGSVILAFGDSLTYGQGVSRDKSYPMILGQLIHHNVINAGINGLDTTNALKILPGLLDQHNPSLVIMSIGGNDMLRKVKVTLIQENIEKLIEMLQARGIDVVLLAEPQPRLLASSPGYYKFIGEKYHIPVEMNLVASLERRAEYKSDLIHLNVQGYEKMAEGVAKLLKKAGAI